ncbi:acyl CoA:acetate/3-ketoacid CoA transferase [Roseibium sp. M-1]
MLQSYSHLIIQFYYLRLLERNCNFNRTPAARRPTKGKTMTARFVDNAQLLKEISNIRNDAVIATTGSGGGLLEPDKILAAFETAFLERQAPCGLTLVHALGLGNKKDSGTNHFAHEGMTKRVIGGHWTWSPAMLRLARDNKIEAYSLPSGVIVHLMREIGAKRPGLITKVGLGTFVDPHQEGGKCNARAQADIVEHMQIGEEDYLRYLPFPVDIGVIRGTFADEFGNICTTEEAADLDIYNIALAARNSGGKVFAQVREMRKNSQLKAREVAVPGSLVDFVHVVPDQPQTYHGSYDLSLAGLQKATASNGLQANKDIARHIIANRAALEMRKDAIVNFGFGVSADVAGITSQKHADLRYWATIEQGIHNGTLMEGDLFGIARNPMAIVSSSEQFDFYSGGGLDQTFLGMAEFDADGNVNVSHIGASISGPGGFIDISQGAKSVIFCGTLTTKGMTLDYRAGQVIVNCEGQIRKAVGKVAGITFSGREALRRGQDVTYVTDRAVFKLTAAGLTLVEIAPGLDLQRDVLDQMDFMPVFDTVCLMPDIVFADLATPATAAAI